MIPIIIMTISLVLDGLLTNYLPYLVNNLSYFTPLLTVVCVFIIYPFYRKNEKKYLITIFLLGIIYDLFYTNLIFFNGCLFFLLGLVTIILQKNFELGIIKIIIYTIMIVTLYELTTGLILYIYNMFPITLDKIYYKITHSLIINIIYMEIVYLIIKILPKKYKKISINTN